MVGAGDDAERSDEEERRSTASSSTITSPLVAASPPARAPNGLFWPASAQWIGHRQFVHDHFTASGSVTSSARPERPFLAGIGAVDVPECGIRTGERSLEAWPGAAGLA